MLLAAVHLMTSELVMTCQSSRQVSTCCAQHSVCLHLTAHGPRRIVIGKHVSEHKLLPGFCCTQRTVCYSVPEHLFRGALSMGTPYSAVGHCCLHTLLSSPCMQRLPIPNLFASLRNDEYTKNQSLLHAAQARMHSCTCLTSDCCSAGSRLETL